MADPLDVKIAGGGVAGMETALALHALAPDATEVTLISPEPEFELRPLAVEEPFTGRPADRRDLRAALDELGAEFVADTLEEVEPDAHRIRLGSGDIASYDALVVCIGVRARPAYSGVETFWADRTDLPIDALIERAGSVDDGCLHFIVPPGTTWALPIYEIALMARRRSEELEREDVRMAVLTPERSPLAIFGDEATRAVADLLEARRIEVRPDVNVGQARTDGPLAASGGGLIDPSLVVALPQLRGPRIPGLPDDGRGFVPVDEFGAVHGIEDVYAAGDGTDFPVKQGGLASQQADAVAEHIAVRAGALEQAEPFRPVLRGRLLTGSDTLNMEHELGRGSEGGRVGPDYLWWPAEKVAGRYLSVWLGHSDSSAMEGPARALDVEVPVPREWHSNALLSDDES